jgi:hypothetical protein
VNKAFDSLVKSAKNENSLYELGKVIENSNGENEFIAGEEMFRL